MNRIMSVLPPWAYEEKLDKFDYTQSDVKKL